MKKEFYIIDKIGFWKACLDIYYLALIIKPGEHKKYSIT